MKQALGGALFDPHYDVASLSLKVHARLLAGGMSVTSHKVTMEIFTSVAGSICTFFKDRSRSHSGTLFFRNKGQSKLA